MRSVPGARADSPTSAKLTTGIQALPADERSPEDLALRTLMIGKEWARCPTCKTAVERISGCPLMKCRSVIRLGPSGIRLTFHFHSCGAGFCYRCNATSASARRPKKCRHGHGP